MITLSDHVGTVLIFDNNKDLAATIVELQTLLKSNEGNPDGPAIQLRYPASITDEQSQAHLVSLKRLFTAISKYPTGPVPTEAE